MNTEDRAMAVLARANPMPDTEDLELKTDAVTYLATLEQRSSEVTQLKPRPVEEDKKTRTTLIAVAAAAVVVLGAVVILLTRSNEEPPVATDPPPTTISVPTTVSDTVAELDPQLEEALAVAGAFTQARADHDIQGMEDNAIEGHINGFVAGSLELMPDEFAWQEAVGWTMQVDGCELTIPDVADTRIRCDVTHSDAISEALGVGPYLGSYHMKVQYAGEEKLGVPIEETTVTESLQIDFPASEFTSQTWRPFVTWLEANHPDDVAQMLGAEVGPNEVALMLSVGERRPNLSQESIDLWRQHVNEFVEDQTSG